MARQTANYLNNVFINCPFDKGYHSLFEAIIFTIHDCGFIPRCAREENDSGAVRIIKIMKIIDECRYGIHDISKADIDINTGLARFNMPLELGLFMGAQHFASAQHYNKEKRSLIMDSEPFRYQKFISDLAGQDIASHHHSSTEVISNVRDFLASYAKRTSIAGGGFITGRFEEFLIDLPDYSSSIHLDRDQLTFLEYDACVDVWINNHPI
ncbi:hypothetical protein [Mucilaginibacter sp.]